MSRLEFVNPRENGLLRELDGWVYIKSRHTEMQCKIEQGTKQEFPDGLYIP